MRTLVWINSISVAFPRFQNIFEGKDFCGIIDIENVLFFVIPEKLLHVDRFRDSIEKLENSNHTENTVTLKGHFGENLFSDDFKNCFKCYILLTFAQAKLEVQLVQLKYNSNSWSRRKATGLLTKIFYGET